MGQCTSEATSKAITERRFYNDYQVKEYLNVKASVKQSYFHIFYKIRC